MLSYAQYKERLERLAAPTRLPEHMPIMYAISLERPISGAGVYDDMLKLTFAGGGTLTIWDNGQSCCENRYMTTDDELETFIGAKLVGFEVVCGPDVEDQPDEDGWGFGVPPHEQMFVKLETTMGTITLVTHNEHNGYYGGFDVESLWED